jgi:hypothetical protein
MYLPSPIMHEQKIPVVITILNELWSVPAVRQFEHQSNHVEFLRVVDSLTRTFQRLRSVSYAMQQEKEKAEVEDEEEEVEETSKYSMSIL